jgi:hypothetical protein
MRLVDIDSKIIPAMMVLIIGRYYNAGVVVVRRASQSPR